MSATQTKSSHAYGIGILVVIVALGVSITWYTSYWLPEENQKVFVDEHVLHPDGETVVNIIMGSATPEQKDNYMPKKIQVQLPIDNKVDFVATIEFEPTEKHDVKFRASIIQQHKEVENAQLFANYSA